MQGSPAPSALLHEKDCVRHVVVPDLSVGTLHVYPGLQYPDDDPEAYRPPPVVHLVVLLESRAGHQAASSVSSSSARSSFSSPVNAPSPRRWRIRPTTPRRLTTTALVPNRWYTDAHVGTTPRNGAGP